MSDENDNFVERINEVLKDFESIEDFRVEDTDDPNVVDMIIRGRLKKDLGLDEEEKEDPLSDYDRAMKGINAKQV